MTLLSGRKQARSVLLLAIAWGCAVGVLFIVVSSGTAAARLLKNESESTLPIGLLAVSAAISAISAQKLVARIGRRPTFLAASALGILSSALFALAMHTQSFSGMLAASVPQGIAYGTSNLYRFAAVDVTLPEYKERALAAVVGGAVLAAFIGPEASRHVRFELLEPYFAAFLLAAGLGVVQFLCLLFVDYTLPKQVAEHKACLLRSTEAEADLKAHGAETVHHGFQSGELPTTSQLTAAIRPWHHIVLQPQYLMASYLSAATFFAMAGLMAATPLAMGSEGFSVDDSTLVIEAHIVAMYLPSFVSGIMVRKLGPPTMLLTGSSLLLLGNALFFVDRTKLVFWLALILIGAGWNFNYVSSSTAVLTTFSQAEKAVGQGLFDVISLSGLAVAMVSSSFTFSGIGWRNMNSVYLGVSASVLAVAALFAWHWYRHPRAKGPA